MISFVIPDADEVAGVGERAPGDVEPGGGGQELVGVLPCSEEVNESRKLRWFFRADVGSLADQVTRKGLSPCNSVAELPAHRGDSPCVSQESPIVINSGFRSPDTNQLCGGATHSNHLTGCAVDIHCAGKEQAIRYACILLDIADGKKMDFDELILEKRGTTIWVHFAVRPKGNRRYVDF
ncbi:MAG: D-Ala-D-Ala carboxypeptidase family metallohydrolase [Prevotella sp.]|nr:D-Ala-D-Ala carboxypeptidase family metallohydrolase [Prevotella sp.]